MNRWPEHLVAMRFAVHLNLIDTNDSKSLISSGLDYIGVAIPTNKFGFGFGIIPYMPYFEKEKNARQL